MLQTKPSLSHLSALFIVVMGVLLLANRPVQSQELAELWGEDTVPISLMAGYGVGGDVSSKALGLGFAISKTSEIGFSITKHDSRIRRNTSSASSIAFSYTGLSPGAIGTMRGMYSVGLSRISGPGSTNSIIFVGTLASFINHELSPETTIYPRLGAGFSAPIKSQNGASPRDYSFSLSSSISMITGKRGARFAFQAGISRNITEEKFFVSIGIGIVFLAPKDERPKR